MGLDEGDAQLGMHSTGCLSQESSRACFTVGFTTPYPWDLLCLSCEFREEERHPNLSCGWNPGQITAEDFLSPEAQMGPTCTFIPTHEVIKLEQLLPLSSCTKENLSQNLSSFTSRTQVCPA